MKDPGIIPKVLTTLALGHLPMRGTVPTSIAMSHSLSLDPFQARYVQPICQAEEIIKLFRRGWKEKDNFPMWAYTVDQVYVVSHFPKPTSNLFLLRKKGIRK